MRFWTWIILVVVLYCGKGISQTGEPYQIYNSNGKKVSYTSMIRKLGKADVVLLGEYHDNSLGHWLQLQVLKSLSSKRDLILGAEMFEADNQNGLSQYVGGLKSEEEFREEVRLWDNYDTDYKPLVEFAKLYQLPFIATNVPRRFASKVYKEGVSSLDNLIGEELTWIAPLPFPYDKDLPGYKAMLGMFGSEHANENLPKAQAIKDATMGYRIVENWRSGSLFLHFNGSYHSNHYEGIVWYLNQYQSDLKIVTLSMVVQEEVFSWAQEHKGLSDFIIVIDQDIIKSF